MLDLALNKKDKKYLTRIFNQYCSYTYNKKYHLTDNNFKIFIKEVFLSHYTHITYCDIILFKNHCSVIYIINNFKYENIIFEKSNHKFYFPQLLFFNDRLKHLLIKKHAK